MSIEHKATARREGRWWVVEVDGIGATQVRDLRDAEVSARDMVALMCEVPVDDVEVRVSTPDTATAP